MNTRLFKRSRYGAVLVETLLAFPVLVLIALAGVQYVQAVVLQQTVQAAADAAAREAAKQSPVPAIARVADVVGQYLGSLGLGIDSEPGSGVRVDLHIGGMPSSSSLGDVTLPQPTPIDTIDNDSTLICVTVQVRYDATSLPNALAYFGIDFENRVFRATALARKQ